MNTININHIYSISISKKCSFIYGKVQQIRWILQKLRGRCFWHITCFRMSFWIAREQSRARVKFKTFNYLISSKWQLFNPQREVWNLIEVNLPGANGIQIQSGWHCIEKLFANFSLKDRHFLTCRVLNKLCIVV